MKRDYIEFVQEITFQNISDAVHYLLKLLPTPVYCLCWETTITYWDTSLNEVIQILIPLYQAE